MAMLQLQPPLPLDTPRGRGYAILAIDYSQEHFLHFAVIQDDTGEIWIYPSSEVKGQNNPTMGRNLPKGKRK